MLTIMGDTVTESFFDTRKTLSIEGSNTKPLKTCLKDDGNNYCVVIKYQEFQFAQVRSVTKLNFLLRYEP